MGKGSKAVTVGYRYFMGLHFGICIGPVDALLGIQVGGREAFAGEVTESSQIQLNKPKLFGGDKREGGIVGKLDVMMGETTQEANDYLQGVQGDPQPGYRGFFGAVYRKGQVSAMNPYLKPWAWKLRRIKKGWENDGTAWYEAKAAITLPSGDKAMNPAHIVYECLTNTLWGMGYSTGLIDEDEFQAAADQFYDEGFGLCIVWWKQGRIEEFIQLIADHVGASVGQDRRTGKFIMRAIRTEEDPETLPLFDESNVVSVDSFKRSANDEMVNEVTVQYTDVATGKVGTVTLQNIASIQATGGVVTTTNSYFGLPTYDLAVRAAERDLRATSTPLAAYSLKANRAAYNLIPGDAIRFSWDKLAIEEVTLRIVRMDYGDLTNGIISIDAVEDIFGLPDASYAAQQPGLWSPPATTPIPPTIYDVFEASYMDMVMAIGQADAENLDETAGYVGALAASPSGLNISFDLYSRVDPEEYEKNGTGDWCATGTISEDIGPTDTSALLDDAIDLDGVEVGTAAMIGTEWVRIDSVDAETGAITFSRGCADTTPASHAEGTRVWFYDPNAGEDRREYADGETVDVKFVTVTTTDDLAIGDAPVDSITIQARQAKPYPPGRLRIDGEAYPTDVDDAFITLTWAHRDRLLQADKIIPEEDTSIGPEAGTTYRIELYDDTDTLRYEQDGLVGTTAVVDLTVLPTNDAKLKLWSARGGVDSWQAATAMFSFPFTLSFVVLPLTYDEVDYAATMTWVRQGDGPHVTPSGFEADGYQARMKSTTIPTWMDGAGDRVSIQATITPYQERPRASTIGDTIIYLGPDTAGVAPSGKMALRMLAETEDATRRYMAFQTNTGVTQTLALARPEWRFEFRFPVLEKNGQRVRPQGIHFIDADEVVVCGHYNNTESVAYKIDTDTAEVLGSFSFGELVHVSSFAATAGGDVWCLDYTSKRAVEIDLDASFTAGEVVLLSSVDLSNFIGPSSLAFITVSSVEYVLMGEYDTTGTPYLYVFLLSDWLDGAAPAEANRYKRFYLGQRNQGTAISGGHLYVSKNRDQATSNTHGWIERYDNIGTVISGTADGATLTAAAVFPAPSKFPQDVKFHPTSGHLWTMTEGWSGVADTDGWLSAWSSPLNGTAVENTVGAYYTGIGSFNFHMNGRPFDTKEWTPSLGVAAVSVGGPSNQAAGNRNGYFAGYIKNFRLQNAAISAEQYQETYDGDFEPSSLTAYTLTLTNPAAESGSATGWTNEVGGLAVRSTNPVPAAGSFYFSGGSNAQTIARQRLDIVTQTGLSGAAIDAAVIWAKARWIQSSFQGAPGTSDDPSTVGLRTLNGTPTTITESYSGIVDAPHCTGGGAGAFFWYNRAHALTIASGTRNLDALYRADRASGTNNDGYIDSITITVYKQ